MSGEKMITRHTLLQGLSAAVILILLACCSALPPTPEEPEELPVRTPPHSGATVMLIGPVPDPFEKQGTFSFQARGTDLREVLRAIFVSSQANLVLDPGVSGSVTVDFKDTSPASALLELLESHDLTVAAEGKTIRIGQEETRMFDLGYVNAAGGQIDSEGSGEGSSAIGGGSSRSSSGGGDEDRENLWEQIEEHLRSLVSSEDVRLVVNPIAGKILVTDRPGVLDLIERYLQEVEESVRRQVLIRAEILEVTMKKSYEMGIDYTAFPDFFKMDEQGLLPGGGLLSQSGLLPQEAAFNFGILKLNEFALLVRALQDQGQVKVLQSPRIATLNNQPAILAVVDRVPVIEREVVDGEGSTRTQYEIRYEDVGITVQVTPQISSDGRIILQVEPRVSEVTGTVTTPDGLQTEPLISERRAFTTLTVQDGQPVLIGGLKGIRKRENLAGIPVLMNIPLLGALFRHTEQESIHVETLIYLVPSILDGDGMRRAVEKGLNRIERVQEAFRFSPLDMASTTEIPGPFSDAIPAPRTSAGLERFASLPRETASELSPRGLSTYFRDVGYRRYLKGDLQRARRVLRFADAIHPLKGYARLLLGIIALESGSYAEARYRTRLALSISPDNPYALNNMGAMEIHAGRLEEAGRLLRRSMKALPGNDHLRNNLAVSLVGQGRFAEAQYLWNHVLDRNPDHPEASRNLRGIARYCSNPVIVPMEESLLPEGEEQNQVVQR